MTCSTVRVAMPSSVFFSRDLKIQVEMAHFDLLWVRVGVQILAGVLSEGAGLRTASFEALLECCRDSRKGLAHDFVENPCG